MGRLLDQLGLKPLARSTPAGSSATTAQATAPAQGRLGAAPAAAGSKRGAGAKGELTLGGASIEKLSLGPPVKGPRLGVLWALMAEDGSGPLNSSNSQVGARLNTLGHALMVAYPRLAEAEKAWYGMLDDVTRMSNESKQDLAKLKSASKAIGSRTKQRGGAYVRTNSEAYLKAQHEFERVLRSLDPLESALRKAVAQYHAAGINVQAEAKKRETERLKEDIEKEKKRLEELKKRLNGLLGIAIKVVKQDWTEVAEEAAKFVGEQLIDQIPSNRLPALEAQLAEATAALEGLQDLSLAATLESTIQGVNEASQNMDNARKLVDAALEELALAQKTAVESLGETDATAPAAKMIAQQPKMLKLMERTRVAIGRYQAASKPMLVDLDKVAVLYKSLPDLMKRMSGFDPNSAYARSLAATARENAETLDVWTRFIQETLDSAQTALGMLADTGDTGYLASFNQVPHELQKAIANR